MNYLDSLLKYLSNLFQWWVIIMPWERGLRVRFGNRIKVLSGGVHFKIPFFDAVYVQTTRLRVMALPLQTLSTSDEKTITINVALGYTITDIHKMYTTLYHPESTLSNIMTGHIAEYVSTHKLSECSPSQIDTHISQQLKGLDYGVSIEYFRVVGFMNVKTYRLISDQMWVSNGIDIDLKR